MPSSFLVPFGSKGVQHPQAVAGRVRLLSTFCEGYRSEIRTELTICCIACIAACAVLDGAVILKNVPAFFKVNNPAISLAATALPREKSGFPYSSFHDGRSDGKLGERKHREDKELGELHVEKVRLDRIGQDLIF
jgi:hypothetical protein